MLSRFFVILPILLSVVAFILSMLALFAGHKEGFMEDYAIARLNTSMLGHNMLETDGDASTNDNDDDDDDGFFDRVTDKWNEVKDDIKDEINDITGNIADELADTLGISEWYSIHVMDACQGQYKPNATAKNAGLNTTDCTDSDPGYRFNLTGILDQQLSVGPFDLSLADINWPDDIQDTVDTLNDALLGLFVLFVLGVGFSGLCVMGGIAGFFLFLKSVIVWMNLIMATLSALCLTICSILVTVAGKKGVDKINDIGDDIGISAKLGTKFIVITWVAAGCMMAVTMYWLTQLCLMRREKKKRWTPRKGSL